MILFFKCSTLRIINLSYYCKSLILAASYSKHVNAKISISKQGLSGDILYKITNINTHIEPESSLELQIINKFIDKQRIDRCSSMRRRGSIALRLPITLHRFKGKCPPLHRDQFARLAVICFSYTHIFTFVLPTENPAMHISAKIREKMRAVSIVAFIADFGINPR